MVVSCERLSFGAAGVIGEDLAEIVIAEEGYSAYVGIDELQQGAKFSRRGTAKVVLRPRDVFAAFLPETAALVRIARGEERIEVCADGRVHAVSARVAVAGGIGGEFDAGQVGLKSHPFEILQVRSPCSRSLEQRAAKEDGRGV